MRFLQFIFFIIFIIKGSAAVSPKETNFMTPIKQTLRISGNFGELRGGHFHAGLDIKGSEGENIYAAEEGYVSRIKIQRGGYGRAVYIDHPNGYTTVYAHLKSYHGYLGEYVLSQQQSAQSYEIDIRPTPGTISLQKGDLLGFLGNSGHSFGAHLHFEVRESVSDNPMNPMLFNIRPFDDQAPTINSVRITGLDETFQKYGTNKFSTKKDKTGEYQPLNIQTQEAIVGLSIAGFDRNNFGSNQNGIYKMKMYVNGAPYYSFNMNAFSFEESHLIEAHTEYEERSSGGAKEVACYRLPGNQLTIIDEQINNGLIYLQDSTTTEVRFVLTDFHGNTATQVVNIFKSTSIPRSFNQADNIYKHGQRHEINKDGLNVTIGENSLHKDIPIPVYLSGDNTFYVGSGKYPVLSPIMISATVPERFLPFMDKVGLMLLGSSPNYFGQKFDGGLATTQTTEFGRYGFYVDTIPPKITPQNLPSKGKITASVLRFKLTDNVTPRGAAKAFQYHVYLDGNWIPCELKETTDILNVPIDNLGQGEHLLLITATDQFGNESRWEKVFETGG
jgi:hypothetical protein